MSHRGLTLIEVLVALLVACVTMAAAARSAAAVRLGACDSELLEKAALLADERLEERIARGPLGIAEDASTESIDDRLGRFERQVVVEPGPRFNLWHVAVEVAPPRNRPHVSLHTLLRRPWSEP